MNTNKTKEFEAFYKQFTTRNYKKGEMLIRADDDPQGIFCLKDGYVRQYNISKTGNELTLHILKPISYFPMVWAVNGTPRRIFKEVKIYESLFYKFKSFGLVGLWVIDPHVPKIS